MKGDPQVISHLNKILTNELTAINQYFLHARILKNWGLKRIAHKLYEESIDEMKHADKMVERILFLEGLPNLQDLGKLAIGEDVPEILNNDLKVEHTARADVIAAITVCEQVRDYESREILEDLLEDTEEHIDWIETQLDLIQRVGLTAYQQEQIYGDCLSGKAPLPDGTRGFPAYPAFGNSFSSRSTIGPTPKRIGSVAGRSCALAVASRQARASSSP